MRCVADQVLAPALGSTQTAIHAPAGGGTKRMHSGAVARIRLRVRNTARMGTVTVVLTDATSVDSDTRATQLADTTTSLEIR
jgi:hypothetical protein